MGKHFRFGSDSGIQSALNGCIGRILQGFVLDVTVTQGFMLETAPAVRLVRYCYADN